MLVARGPVARGHALVHRVLVDREALVAVAVIQNQSQSLALAATHAAGIVRYHARYHVAVHVPSRVHGAGKHLFFSTRRAHYCKLLNFFFRSIKRSPRSASRSPRTNGDE